MRGRLTSQEVVCALVSSVSVSSQLSCRTMICFIALIKLIYKIKGVQFQNAQPGPAAVSCLPGSTLYNSLLSIVYLVNMIEI